MYVILIFTVMFIAMQLRFLRLECPAVKMDLSGLQHTGKYTVRLEAPLVQCPVLLTIN